jgi:hypothetical protein
VPRYVILEHDHPTLHWDLMLEAGEALRTWRLAAPPEAGRAVPAEPSFDHRKAYLDYEGPVSGGRGVVSCWDRGDYSPGLEEATRPDGSVAVVLCGRRLCGPALLAADGAGAWTFRATAAH